MKKFSFVFGALILGFMLVSCSNSSKVKNAMIADVDAYFDQALANLDAINDAEDFLDYAAKMSDGSDIESYLLERWDKDVKISDKDYNDLLDHVKEKSTNYFMAEKNKCIELMGPAIDRFNAIIDKMYPMYQAGQRFDDETMEEFLDVFNYLNMFMDYDNAMDVLEESIGESTGKMGEMTEVINQRIAEMYQ